MQLLSVALCISGEGQWFYSRSGRDASRRRMACSGASFLDLISGVVCLQPCCVTQNVARVNSGSCNVTRDASPFKQHNEWRK